MTSNFFESRYLQSNELRQHGFKSIGENVQISDKAIVVGPQNISIGSNVRIDSNVVILSRRGELRIGSNVHIEPHSSLVAHFGIQIGNFCTISHGVRLFTASANYNGDYFTNVFPADKYQVPFTGKIMLEDHVIVGANSVVLPGVVLSEGAAIGALSFVRTSLPGWTVYGGNPIRRISSRNTNIRDIGISLLEENEKF